MKASFSNMVIITILLNAAWSRHYYFFKKMVHLSLFNCSLLFSSEFSAKQLTQTRLFAKFGWSLIQM